MLSCNRARAALREVERAAAPGCPPHVDWVASQFHVVYEQIAIDLGYETRRDSAVPWDHVPDLNKNLMRQTVARLLTRDVIAYGCVTLRRYLPTGGPNAT